MSYERKDIPALIELFSAARHVLVEKTTANFLCHAISSLNNKGFSAIDIHKAKELVREALNYHVALGGFYNYDSRWPCSCTKQRNMRIDWCDKIIRDLQEYAK